MERHGPGPRSLRGLLGQLWALCAAPTQAGCESTHSWAQQRPHCGGVSSLRSRTAVYFSCSKGEGRGGVEELTLLVLTLAQDPWKALEGKRPQEQTLQQGGWGGAASGPPCHTPGAASQSQCRRPVPGAGCWGFRGRERTGKALFMMSPALPWPGPAPALSPPGRDRAYPGKLKAAWKTCSWRTQVSTPAPTSPTEAINLAVWQGTTFPWLLGRA